MFPNERLPERALPAEPPPADSIPLTKEEKRARYREFVRRAMEEAEQARAACMAWLENMVGKDVFATLLQDRHATEQALEGPDPQRRRCAVWLLMKHWPVQTEQVRWCERIALSDSDEGVRKTAMTVFADHYHRSNDPRVGQLLAKVVRSDREPMSVRYAAYLGLIQLRGLVTSRGPLPFQERFLEEADWAFVDSFLRQIA